MQDKAFTSPVRISFSNTLEEQLPSVNYRTPQIKNEHAVVVFNNNVYSFATHMH